MEPWPCGMSGSLHSKMTVVQAQLIPYDSILTGLLHQAEYTYNLFFNSWVSTLSDKNKINTIWAAWGKNMFK